MNKRYNKYRYLYIEDSENPNIMYPIKIALTSMQERNNFQNFPTDNNPFKYELCRQRVEGLSKSL